MSPRQPHSSPSSADPPLVLLLTEAQAAEALGVSPRTVFSLEREGLLRAVRIRGSKRYPVEELRRFVARLQAEASSVDDPDEDGNGAATVSD